MATLLVHMLNKICSLFFSFILMLFSHNSFSNVNNTGFYAGDSDSLGFSNVDQKIIAVTNTSNGGLPYAAGGGYQFNQYFSVEGDYTRYSDKQINLPNDPAKESNIVYMTAKGRLPLGNGLHIFGKAGAAKMSSQLIHNLADNNSDDNQTNAAVTHGKVLPYVGTGLEYGVNQKLGFNVQLAETPRSNGVPQMLSATARLNYQF